MRLPLHKLRTFARGLSTPTNNARTIQKLLGTNKFGKVRRRMGAPSANGAVFNLSNAKYVVKVVPNSAAVNREIKIQNSLAKKNIAPKVQYNRTISVNPSNIRGIFKTSKPPQRLKLFVMNRVGSGWFDKYMSVYNYKKKYGNLNYDDYKKIANKVINMHKEGVLHANMHGENIALVVDRHGKIKQVYIIDFGRSKPLRVTRTGLSAAIKRTLGYNYNYSQNAYWSKGGTGRRNNLSMLKNFNPTHFNRYMREKNMR